MKTLRLGLLETAVTGVVGIGKWGAVSRCTECHSFERNRGTCGGFGDGCLLREQAQEPPASTPSPSTQR